MRIEWSSRFAYAIGLLVADGCVQKDGRHVDLTSVDKAQAELFRKCLGLKTSVSTKRSGQGNIAYCMQFSDVLFHQFLMGIGIFPAKSKTIGAVAVPEEFFVDFVRGYFDGDGSSYSYYDPIFKKSYRFYLSFTSASPVFIAWFRERLRQSIGVKGYISLNRNNPYVQLKYSKREAVRICVYMYHAKDVPCLVRKRLKIMKSMRIIA